MKHYKPVLFALVFVVFGGGCMTTRGALYLQPDKIDVYLLKADQPTLNTKDKEHVESAIKKTKTLIGTIPAADRILGGYCKEADIVEGLEKLVKMAPSCRSRLERYQNRSNLYGALYWGFFAASASAGVAMTLGGLFANTSELKAGLAVGFGIPMLVLALVNGVAPFDRWQEENKALGKRLDNYLWTLRQRVSGEVCNAPSMAAARSRIEEMQQKLKELCQDKEEDNGHFPPPTR